MREKSNSPVILHFQSRPRRMRKELKSLKSTSHSNTNTLPFLYFPPTFWVDNEWALRSAIPCKSCSLGRCQFAVGFGKWVPSEERAEGRAAWKINLYLFQFAHIDGFMRLWVIPKWTSLFSNCVLLVEFRKLYITLFSYIAVSDIHLINLCSCVNFLNIIFNK